MSREWLTEGLKPWAYDTHWKVHAEAIVALLPGQMYDIPIPEGYDPKKFMHAASVMFERKVRPHTDRKYRKRCLASQGVIRFTCVW